MTYLALHGNEAELKCLFMSLLWSTLPRFLALKITTTYEVSGSRKIFHVISHVTIIVFKQSNNTEYCINTFNNFAVITYAETHASYYTVSEPSS